MLADSFSSLANPRRCNGGLGNFDDVLLLNKWTFACDVERFSIPNVTYSFGKSGKPVAAGLATGWGTPAGGRSSGVGVTLSIRT